jgi:stage V sporulation protein K
MNQDIIRVARRSRAHSNRPDDLSYNLLLHIYFETPVTPKELLKLRLYDENYRQIGYVENHAGEEPITETEFSLWSETNWPDGTYFIHLYIDSEPYRTGQVELDVIRMNFSEGVLHHFEKDDMLYYMAKVLCPKPWWNAMNWKHARYTLEYRLGLMYFFKNEQVPPTLKEIAEDDTLRRPAYCVTGPKDESFPIVAALMGRNKMDWPDGKGHFMKSYKLEELITDGDKSRIWKEMKGLHSASIQLDSALLATDDALRNWTDFLKKALNDYRQVSFIFSGKYASWKTWYAPCKALIDALGLTTFNLTEDPTQETSNLVPTEEEKQAALHPQEATAEKQTAVEKLNELVGLRRVKEEVEHARTMALFFRRREKLGLGGQPDHRYHMLFMGNPGTGKTTVAQLIGEMYCEMGLLSDGHVKVVNRGDLVAEYIGQTEAKTLEVIKEARGGVLFIDEAYALADAEGFQSKDFGKEVIHALLPVLSEPNPDLLVIMAGYEDKMKLLLQMNQGLRDRFPLSLHFDDFSDEELLEIAVRLVGQKGFEFSEAAKVRLREVIARATSQRDEHFGNARWVHDLIEQGVWKAMAKRVMACTEAADERTLLSRIEAEDVAAAETFWAHQGCEQLLQRRRVGF